MSVYAYTIYAYMRLDTIMLFPKFNVATLSCFLTRGGQGSQSMGNWNDVI